MFKTSPGTARNVYTGFAGVLPLDRKRTGPANRALRLVLVMQDEDGKGLDVRRRVAVFGGDGFLGSHFVERLLEQGHTVTVFDRFRSGTAKNLAQLQGRVRLIAGDFADQAAVAAALEGQEVAAHFVGATLPVCSWEDPLRPIDVDLRQAVNFFGLCAGQGVRKIIFPASGGTLYGRQSGLQDESSLPAPFNPYGIAKLAAQNFLAYYREKCGIASDSFRIGNVYGPRQPLDRPQGVVAAWIGRILNGQPLELYGDQETVRDYVHAADAALLMTHSLRDLDATDTYNLGSGSGTSILELLSIFRRVSDRPFVCRVQPRRSSDNTSAILTSAKLLRHFPDFHHRPLEEGIRETFRWAMASRQERSCLAGSLSSLPGTPGRWPNPI